MFLLDTMVLSELGKRNPTPQVAGWLDEAPTESLHASVVSFGEIAMGIEMKRASDPAFCDYLDQWSSEARLTFAERTMPVTTQVALRWGRLAMQLRRRDMDLLIAATALEHDLTVVTRNVRHFEPTGAKLLNPYEL